MIFGENNQLIQRIIKQTDTQYKLIDDYEVDITVSLKVPAFRMPKKNIKYFLNNRILLK